LEYRTKDKAQKNEHHNKSKLQRERERELKALKFVCISQPAVVAVFYFLIKS